MQLSFELRKQLNKINSGVTISKTIYGDLPDGYAFLSVNVGRHFSAKLIENSKKFSVLFLEYGLIANNHDHCFGRVIFKDVKKLAIAVDLWVAKKVTIIDLKNRFPEIEIFEPFAVKNENPEIEKSWIKVQNRFFKSEFFLKNKEWQSRHNLMLLEAKKRKEFRHLFPFLSHYWLRFSFDASLKKIWGLGIYGTATFESNEGDFFVGVQHAGGEGFYFNNVHDALSFYARVLNEIKPINLAERWGEIENLSSQSRSSATETT